MDKSGREFFGGPDFFLRARTMFPNRDYFFYRRDCFILQSRIFFTVENFFIVENFFVIEIFFTVENFFIVENFLQREFFYCRDIYRRELFTVENIFQYDI